MFEEIFLVVIKCYNVGCLERKGVEDFCECWYIDNDDLGVDWMVDFWGFGRMENGNVYFYCEGVYELDRGEIENEC